MKTSTMKVKIRECEFLYRWCFTQVFHWSYGAFDKYTFICVEVGNYSTQLSLDEEQI